MNQELKPIVNGPSIFSCRYAVKNHQNFFSLAYIVHNEKQLYEKCLTLLKFAFSKRHENKVVNFPKKYSIDDLKKRLDEVKKFSSIAPNKYLRDLLNREKYYINSRLENAKLSNKDVKRVEDALKKNDGLEAFHILKENHIAWNMEITPLSNELSLEELYQIFKNKIFVRT